MAAWGADARYTRLVHKQGDQLVRLALLMTGSLQDAEDVVQEVFIAVASSWPVLQPVAYLKRSVANKCIDLIRRRREIPTESVPDSEVEELGYFEHDDLGRFFVLLQDLPPRQRETLVLRYQFDLSDATVAKMLGVSVATVRSQAQHALRKLRQASTLAPEGDH